MCRSANCTQTLAKGVWSCYNEHMTNNILTDGAFFEALSDLPAFLLETDADLDMAYDWVADKSQHFADDDAAFDLFYDVYNETFDAW